MGHFSASCMVSGLDIPHGEVALIPLLKNQVYDQDDPSLIPPMPVSNDGSFIYYYPLTLPIYGEYDEYGRLENIVEDENTKAIEKKFNLPIADFVEQILEGEFKLETKGISFENDVITDTIVVETVTAGWVNKEIYDMSSTFQSSYGSKANALSGDLSHKALELLGFVYKEKDESRKRYKKLFQHPEISDFDIYSDGTWIDSSTVGNSCYSPNDLVKFVKSKFNYNLDTSQFKTVYHTQYEHAQLSLKTRVKEKKEMLSLMGREFDDEYLDTLINAAFNGREGYAMNIAPVGNYDSLKEIYMLPVIEDQDWYKEEVCKWKGVYWSMYANNRYVMPGNSGIQDGEHYGKIFASCNVLKQILNSEKGKAEKWDEPERYEDVLKLIKEELEGSGLI